jgi:hypothetical protein
LQLKYRVTGASGEPLPDGRGSERKVGAIAGWLNSQAQKPPSTVEIELTADGQPHTYTLFVGEEADRVFVQPGEGTKRLVIEEMLEVGR